MFFVDTCALPASVVLTYRSTLRATSLAGLGLDENHRTPHRVIAGYSFLGRAA